MKNIHLIKTDKPSRLWSNNLRRRLELDEFPSQHPTNIAKHIYITSDEEIKEGDYRLNIQRDYFKKSDKEGLDYYNKRNDVFKKVILTTDQDLIKDSVQAIDDEFLNWFVKNPNCDEVKLEYRYNFYAGKYLTHYKIIIPKEETTAYHYLSCCRSIEECHCGKYPKQIKCYCGHTITCDCSLIDEPNDVVLGYKTSLDAQMLDKIEPKQETLEEAAVNCWAEGTWDNRDSFTDGFVEGAKWMQDKNKNKYSEEDMLDFAYYLIKNVSQYSDDRIAHFEGKYLEQFKKK